MSGVDKTSGASRRRGFLKAAGLGSAAAATTSLLSAVPATEAQAMRASRDQRAARYQESEHVKKYYEQNRR